MEKEQQNLKLLQLYLIRHGQSKYNQTATHLRQSLGLKAVWSDYLSNAQFMNFKYNQSMIDCPLSSKGQQQCIALKTKIKQSTQISFDAVLVSPLYRALQTCQIIFADTKNIPIIVEPLLAESLRCSCDLTRNIPSRIIQFPNFDFNRLKGREKYWYLENQCEPKRSKYFSMIHDQMTASQIAQKVLDYMRQTHEYEDSHDLLQRRSKLISLLQQMQLKYQNICLVSHYYSLLYLKEDKFDQKGKVIGDKELNNADLIKKSIQIKHKIISFIQPQN